jgi:TrmH family RNA methyltransferase
MGKSSERSSAGAFVVEGVRLVEEGAKAGWPASLVLYSDALSARGKDLVARLATAGAETELVAGHVLASISATETPQGLLAVFKTHSLPVAKEIDFVVIADGIRDPGNLGALLRTAAAAGVQLLIVTPGSVDVYSPKVLRAAMGAHFHLPVQNLDWSEIKPLLKEGAAPLHVFVADAGQGLACWTADLRQPCALVIGSEAEGVSQAARDLADAALTIPMPGQSESLNAAAAASILIFEVVRQRLTHSPTFQ